MRTVGETAKIMFRRPKGLLWIGFVLFGVCLAEYMLLGAVFSMFGSVDTGNGLESFVSFIQHIINPLLKKATIVGPGIIIGLFVGALLVGMALAGYFNLINRSMLREPKIKNEILKGIKKYSIPFTMKSFVVLLTAILLGIFMMVSTVPAIVATRAVYGGKESLLPVAVLFDLLTVGVLFFCFMFYRIYMFFWYPSTMNEGKSAFSKGKKLADRGFWKILWMFLFFDILFIIPQFFVMRGIYIASAQEGFTFFKVGVFIGDWVFKILFFMLFFSALFCKYHQFKNVPKEG